MHNIAVGVTNYLVEREIVAGKDQAWCIYALEKRLLTALTIFAMLLLGVLVSNFFSVLAFIFPFLWLRANTGGYHASTPWACLLLSLVVEGVALGILLPYMNTVFFFTALGVGASLIWWLAPLNHKSLHLNQAELAANRTSARKRLLMLVLISGLLLAMRQAAVAYTLSLVVAIVAGSLTAAKIKKQEEMT